jgi:uncharacterized protein DUF4157
MLQRKCKPVSGNLAPWGGVSLQRAAIRQDTPDDHNASLSTNNPDNAYREKDDGWPISHDSTAGRDNAIPSIVHEVLNSPGRPLDLSTRTYVEPRFGRDFSQVRVHADARAAQSASAVNALAYAAGNHVVFGAERYSPQIITGKILLAHELAHVVQQQSAPQHLPEQVSSGSDSSENEARRAAAETVQGKSVQIGKSVIQPAVSLSPLSDQAMVAWAGGTEDLFDLLRQHSPLAMPDPDLEIWMSIYLSPNDLWHARKILESGPEDIWSESDREELSRRTFLESLAGKEEKQSPKKDQVPSPVQHAGKKLTAEETQAILKILSLKAAPVSDVSGKLESRLFVVHDTATPIKAAELESRDKKVTPASAPQKGPLGVGYSVVKRSGETVENRKSMFEQDRPTATEWEKAEEVMDAPTRVKLMRKVWAGLDPTQRTDAINSVKTKFGLTDTEIKDDKQSPAEELNPTNTCVPKGEEPCIHTLGRWAVERVCKTQTWAAPAATGATKTATEKERDTKLEAAKSACGELDPIFKLRAERVPFTTNVEIRQVGEAPFPEPFYTEEQYAGVKTLYLKAALEAGAFPSITTHFWVDRAVRGHNDPRCFDMHKLNKLISKSMGYNPADLYGDEPKYGIKWGEHNVWWGKDCKGSPSK